MLRIRFVKEGNAVWISHLDLMRVLQRSFRRAGILLKHSQGYSPHPELSIVMPLSVGVSSSCELADFSLDPEDHSPAASIPQRLNPVLPQGIRVLDCREDGKKVGKLAWLRARLRLTYDQGVPAGAAQAIDALFARPSLPVEKHSKKGPAEVDIQAMHREITVTQPDAFTLILDAVVAAQNPTLNPLLLAAAIETYLPACRPDDVKCHRLELYDENLEIFR